MGENKDHPNGIGSREAVMPPDFRYREVFEAGRPYHEPFSEFDLKHPKMEMSRRAKLFAPFDAMAGYKELIAEVERKHEEEYR